MHTSRIQQIGKVLGPMLAATMLTAFLAGCNQTTTQVPSDDTTGMSQSSADTMPEETMSSSSSSMTPTSDNTTGSDVYADGTYSATGNYKSPNGPETVDVTLTLKDDVITDATFKGNATNPISTKMQTNFSAGFKEAVVGKSIDKLSLSVVNGSSLTPMGFMDAVAKIKAEAKA